MEKFTDVLLMLVDNPLSMYEEATRLLIKIADNILKDPSDVKFRSMRKDNTTLSKKILPVSGALECLILMGFKEDAVSISMPMEASLKALEYIRNELDKFKQDPSKYIPGNFQTEESVGVKTGAVPRTNNVSSHSTKATNNTSIINPIRQDNNIGSHNQGKEEIEIGLPIVLPPLQPIFNHPFLNEIEYTFHVASVYDDQNLTRKAIKFIPKMLLELRAQDRLRNLQVEAKKDGRDCITVDLQDMLILELLTWFKSDFFQWVDSPNCKNCNGPTEFWKMSTDKEHLIFTNRVEMHKCRQCGDVTLFPRYTDLNILMETRRGRCGEWASTFTLFCRAMKWDARQVFDRTDHVWTEVYSNCQRRWLHCDPCENACDTPLMYEIGWGKKISYVIAYSAEEVQDVTWRYSCDHLAVRKRRTLIDEEELASALNKLREIRLQVYTIPRQEYLRKRILIECVELMLEQKPSEKDQIGRISGSNAWKLSRGEIKPDSYTWNFDRNITDANNIIIFKYSPSINKYLLVNEEGLKLRSICGWQNAVFISEHIFRKEELDWDMVYLCRQEGYENGKITWKFNFENIPRIKEVYIKFQRTLYENGSVTVTVSDAVNTLTLHDFESTLKNVSTSKGLTITAELSGGQGDVAWQHAQLLRQSTKSNDYPFIIIFSLK